MSAPARFPIVHPMRRPSQDEMVGRNLIDIQDPGAAIPTKCSGCGRPQTVENPFMLEPVDRSPKALAICYLYKAVCARCKEAKAKRR